MTTSSDPHGVHDWLSAAYVDAWITSDVTRDEERWPWLLRVAQLLPFDRGQAIRVLDVGAGYGMLSRAVLETFGASEVVLHDLSTPMLRHAEQRLAAGADRVRFVQADLRDPTWVGSIPGRFDAVVSALAIHNVREPEIIRRIYADVRSLVVAGGCFYNMDIVPAAGPLTARALWGRRVESSESGPAEVPSLEAHLRWLREAGFDEADCLLRVDQHTVVAGFVA
jgi:SAM-dependent methyltransferase